MTDRPLPDDELLSSYLDGELAVDEVAQVDARLASDPSFAEHLDALRAAETLTATAVTPLDAGDADRMIATALAASATASNVTDLAAASAQRKVWPARLATVAAGVIALALAVPALRAIDTGSDSDDAGSADTSSDDSFDGGSFDNGDDTTAADVAMQESAPNDAAEGDMPANDMADDDMAAMTDDALGGDGEATFDPRVSALLTSTAFYSLDGTFDPLPAEIGDFDDIGALSDALSIQWSAFRLDEEPASSTTTTTAELEDDFTFDEVSGRALENLNAVGLGNCPSVLETLVERFGDDPVLALDYATATVAGDPVTVGLFEMPDGRATVVVIDQATCSVRDVILN